MAGVAAGMIGRCVRPAALDGGAPTPPVLPEIILQICSCFFFPPQTNACYEKKIKKYFHNRIPQAWTRNNRPFSASCFPSPHSDDLRASNNEASSSIKSFGPSPRPHTCSELFIWLYLRMTSIACRPFAIVFTVIFTPLSPAVV